MMLRRHKARFDKKQNEPAKGTVDTVPFYGEVKYTKTDISRMSTSDLQSLAAAQGMENAKELSGAELKKLLIEKFGL